MSDDWQTKYGTRRVRREPPTLDEAIFAAAGITEVPEEQADIAAALMGLSVDEVLPEVRKATRAAARSTTVIAGEPGAKRAVIVERRVTRRFPVEKRALIS